MGNEVTIRRHRPERLSDSIVVGSVCCSCCCCCCCCLHTVAGLAGAAIGSQKSASSRENFANQTADRQGASQGVLIYWLTLTGVLALVLLGSALAGHPFVGAGIVILLLPILQLVASTLSFPLVLLTSSAEGRSGGVRAVSYATLGSLVGIALGALALLGIGLIAVALK